MGTSANIHIKTKDRNIQYTAWMNGDYDKLGVYIMENLCYKKNEFLDIINDNEETDFEDKYQSYVYRIDCENSHVYIYCGDENINNEVIEYLTNNRKDLVDMVVAN